MVYEEADNEGYNRLWSELQRNGGITVPERREEIGYEEMGYEKMDNKEMGRLGSWKNGLWRTR